MMKRFALAALFALSLIGAAPKATTTTQFDFPLPHCLPCRN